MAQEPTSTTEVTKRVVQIFDFNYEKTDLQAVVHTTVPHLSLHEKKKSQLLKEFEELFDGTLNNWTIDPVSFEVKVGTKQHHCRPNPAPNMQKTTIMKLNRLCDIGVLEFQCPSEWTSL